MFVNQPCFVIQNSLSSFIGLSGQEMGIRCKKKRKMSQTCHGFCRKVGVMELGLRASFYTYIHTWLYDGGRGRCQILSFVMHQNTSNTTRKQK